MVCLIAAYGSAAAEPQSKPVDVKAFKDELLVLQDSAGGTYVVRPGPEATVFYGTGKVLYEQARVGRTTDGDAWSINTWAPRLVGIKPGSIDRHKDGSFHRWCDGKDDLVLTQRTGDKAKAILDKSTLMSEYMVRRPHLLGRDDAGIYYYVDRLRSGKGYRVYIGKKGAMKQVPLLDVASDTAGEVFSTKGGDLRLVRSTGSTAVTWIKGEKRTTLMTLDIDASSPLIFSELGIYKFLGTLCDNI